MKLQKHWILVFLAVSTTFLSGYRKGDNWQKKLKGYQYVPSGTMVFNGETISVAGFYMAETEVTNAQYRAFLNDLKAQGKMDLYEKARVDSVRWNDAGIEDDSLIKYYHRHPSFDQYPVVNISREGAELYCQWLTEHLSKQLSVKLDPFRLPYEVEWVKAARGGLKSSPYPWGGPYLQNKQGDFLCRFRYVPQAHIYQDKETGELQVLTKEERMKDPFYQVSEYRFPITPAKAYAPNNYGFYNMSGNVAEMVVEKGRTKGGSWNNTAYYVKIDAEDPYEGFKEASPFIGFRPCMTFLGRKLVKQE